MFCDQKQSTFARGADTALRLLLSLLKRSPRIIDRLFQSSRLVSTTRLVKLERNWVHLKFHNKAKSNWFYSGWKNSAALHIGKPSRPAAALGADQPRRRRHQRGQLPAHGPVLRWPSWWGSCLSWCERYKLWQLKLCWFFQFGPVKVFFLE